MIGTALLISTDQTDDTIQRLDNINFEPATYYKLIDCSCIDIVSCMGSDELMENHIEMIVDDEALFVDEASVNVIASLLYGYLGHGQGIFGNALVVSVNEQGETLPLTEKQIEIVMKNIILLVQQAKD